MEKELLTIREASKILGVAESTLRDWLYEGKIPFYRLGRCIRFRPEDIEKIQKEGLETSVK